MSTRTLVIFLLALTFTGTLTAQTISPYDPSTPDPAEPPCVITNVGAYLWMGYFQSGWMYFSCTEGYTGQLEVSVGLELYGSGSSSTVSVLPYAEVSDSWPKTFFNSQCRWNGMGFSCPAGVEPITYEYAPSSGGIDVSADGAGCFRTVARLTWARSYYETGSQTVRSDWKGICY